ncbi:Transcriptional regulator, LysR family [Myxococcus hansupus]|uniref:Transcriptional regulator, LysR family n=1 Tax=Pseudomyxococcus hansupus TaxID=1297742 RepID=A0A0H4X965_9BACT|nr:LysR family transcriptional regulator [Myxococcus hansupus]AKQ70110.1 Transcriptional regulator, LysR family [Myxococcus hansupus]
MSWDDYRLLLELRRHGSFLAAGVRLGLSASTVMRRIGKLEEDLGRTLVHRTARGVWLEPEAEELARMAEQFEHALAARVRDAAASPFAGSVRVSVSDGFAPYIAEAAVRVRRVHPEIHVEIVTEQRYADLSTREADIGLRAISPVGARTRSDASPVLIEKPLGDIVSGLFASRDYLDQHLPSRKLADADFSAHDFIVDEYVGRRPCMTDWLLQRGAHRFPLRTNSVAARMHAARAGMGLVIGAIGAVDEQRGLERVRLETPGPSLTFCLVMHEELRKVPRVRAVVSALTEMFDAYLEGQRLADG